MHHGRRKYHLFFIIERRNGGNAIVIMVRIDGLNAHPELYKAQMDRLSELVDKRLAGDVNTRASGITVNTAGWIEDIGYNYIACHGCL
jgi:hypothetical protein